MLTNRKSNLLIINQIVFLTQKKSFPKLTTYQQSPFTKKYNFNHKNQYSHPFLPIDTMKQYN